jgi:lipopolysaccharide biosynthesis glycosyltransferase
MNYFVIQCYGKERILREAKFCVLSLLKFIKGNTSYKIILYTDNQEYFSDINDYLSFEPLTAETVQEWKGKHNFVHRVKIKMLLDFMNKYSGKFIYLDSDTWFTTSPEKLFIVIDSKNALMHLPEARMDSKANPIIKKMHRFVKNNSFKLSGDDEIKIPGNYFMWNAGVIGLETAAKPVVEKVLELTDVMLDAYQKHVMEQLAFSYFLQHKFTVHRTDNVIAHYWQYCAPAEQPMKALLDSSENKPVEERIEEVHSFNWKDINLPEKPKGLKKIIKKIFG